MRTRKRNSQLWGTVRVEPTGGGMAWEEALSFSKPRGVGRVFKRQSGLAILILVTLIIAFVVLWLMAQHKPAWYRPAVASPATVQEAQEGIAALADSISDQMVRRKPFEIVLVDRSVNLWLAAAPSLDPEIPQSLPEEISSPAVSFGTGGVRIGVHYASKDWQAILGVAGTLKVSKDGREIEVKLQGVHSGSLPLPRRMLRQVGEMLGEGLSLGRGSPEEGDQPLGALLEGGYSIDDFLAGVHIPNWFVWPNGDRPFRIDSIETAEGTLRLGIEPL